MLTAGRIPASKPRREFVPLQIVAADHTEEQSAAYAAAKQARWEVDATCNQCTLTIKAPEDADFVADVIGQSTPALVHRTCLSDFIQRIAMRAIHMRGRR